MRNNLIKDYNYLLVQDSFEELELKLVEEYIFYFEYPFNILILIYLMETLILFKVKDFLDASHSHYNSQDKYYKMQKTRECIRYLFYR